MLGLGDAYAADSGTLALQCPPGRNEDRPQPPWWPSVRAHIAQNLEHFPPGVDLPFLGAWIEHESDGRHALVSRLDEVGYFQLHPLEIESMAGKAKVPAVMASIRSSPELSIRWGGALLRHYDEAIQEFDIPRRGPLYHGLLKVMHSSRPRGRKWLRHVTAVLGRNPRSFDEFLGTAVGLKDGAIQSPRSESIPSKLPSCAPSWLLARRSVFMTPHERQLEATTESQTIAQAIIRSAAAVALPASGILGAYGTLGAITKFAIDFASPIDNAHVFSGWGRPRPARNGVHEGLDITAAVGTPVVAAADGLVDRTGSDQHSGRFTAIRHFNGFETRYMHLSDWIAKSGQAVKKGDLIALSGDTAIRATEPHLHFDTRIKEELLPRYVELFGEPVTGFGTRRDGYIAVPSEPLIPVGSYSMRTISDALKNGVPLHAPEGFPWGKVAIGGVLVALLGVGVYRWRTS